MSNKLKFKIIKINEIKENNDKITNNSTNTFNPTNFIDLRKITRNDFNNDIVNIINQLITYTEIKVKTDKKQAFRLSSFRKALYSIQNCNFKITSGKMAMSLDGIGKGTADRIDEFLKTGKIAELQKEITGEQQLLIDLQNVHGIGPKTAETFISLGVKDIKDLYTKIHRGEIKSTHSISIGLKYYDDFKEKIPFSEIYEIYGRINKIICSKYAGITMDVCGSHRRKKPLSGDIDILITHKDNTFGRELPNIIKLLIDEGILIDHLTELGQTKYMGVCVHPDVGIGRRIDIRFINYESYYYALLYFTGSVWVNKEMRIIAIKKNMTLNEYSLTNNYDGQKYIVNSEKEIFDILEIVYLSPEEREL